MANADRYQRSAGESRTLVEQLSGENHRRILLHIAQEELWREHGHIRIDKIAPAQTVPSGRNLL